MAEKKPMGIDEIQNILTSKSRHWSSEVRAVVSDLILEISAKNVRIATLEAEIAAIRVDNQRLVKEKEELLTKKCDR